VQAGRKKLFLCHPKEDSVLSSSFLPSPPLSALQSLGQARRKTAGYYLAGIMRSHCPGTK